MGKKRRIKGHLSTLNPWLAGTRIDNKAVTRISRDSKKSPTRPVVFRSYATEPMPVPVLQDHLLIHKGYLPKYSGMSLSALCKSGGFDYKRLKAQQKVYDGKK